MRWYLIDSQQYSENTPEYGHGDYPEQLAFIRCVVEAETLRKAQDACKKIDPRTLFGGQFSPMLLAETDKYLSLYTKPADPRLGPNATALHEAALHNASI